MAYGLHSSDRTHCSPGIRSEDIENRLPVGKGEALWRSAQALQTFITKTQDDQAKILLKVSLTSSEFGHFWIASVISREACVSAHRQASI
jgi:hypothetical protein